MYIVTGKGPVHSFSIFYARHGGGDSMLELVNFANGVLQLPDSISQNRSVPQLALLSQGGHKKCARLLPVTVLDLFHSFITGSNDRKIDWNNG